MTRREMPEEMRRRADKLEDDALHELDPTRRKNMQDLARDVRHAAGQREQEIRRPRG